MKMIGKVFIVTGGLFLLATFALVASDSFGWSLKTPIVESFDAQLFSGLTGVLFIQMGRAMVKKANDLALVRERNDWWLVQQSRKQRRKEGKDERG